MRNAGAGGGGRGAGTQGEAMCGAVEFAVDGFFVVSLFITFRIHCLRECYPKSFLPLGPLLGLPSPLFVSAFVMYSSTH